MGSMKSTPLWILALAIPLAMGAPGCTRFSGPTAMVQKLKVQPVASPAPQGSRWPSLAEGGDGKLYLCWTETRDQHHTLRFSVWLGETWSKARTIAEGDEWFVNWADFPTMAALPDGTLAAHWLAKSSAGTYSYDIALVLSRDEGQTWSAPIHPHRDATETEHGFVSMLSLAEGGFGLFWLDGREMTAAGGDMALRYTTVGPGGELGQEVLVDARVCECCQTSALQLGDRSLLAVYRDRSLEETRDIGLARLSASQVTEQRILHNDHWKIEGCPVNGPAIASLGKRVAVCWFTVDSQDRARILLTLSQDGGRSFGPPIPVAIEDPLGRVDVLFLSENSLLVSWMESLKDEAEIRISRVLMDGTVEPFTGVANTANSRAAGFARLGRAGDTILITWTETPSIETTAIETTSRVQTARLVLK